MKCFAPHSIGKCVCLIAMAVLITPFMAQNGAAEMEALTDAETEIEQLREEMEAQRKEIRADLADKLGGEPEDYNAEKLISEATTGVDTNDE